MSASRYSSPATTKSSILSPSTRIQSNTSISYPTRHRIAIIGLGYVGLPLAILAEERGHAVVGFDIDERKIKSIQAKEVNHISPKELTALRVARNFKATNREKDLDSVDTFIICVPTPVSEAHEPDLAPLESACRIVAQYLDVGSLVVIESTIHPGVCDKIVVPILEKISGLTVEKDFYLAHCPERVNPGDENWTVRTIPRVIGGAGAASLQKAAELYRSIVEGDVLEMPSLKAAEAVKMVENAFRDVNIAFVNELAMSFDKAGIDLTTVLTGAATKPFSFMPHFPGCGVGGHCIPVDPYYLIRYGEENGFVHTFLKAARRINAQMPLYTVNLLAHSLRKRKKQIGSSTIALLGLSYKSDIPDMRESPSIVIKEILEDRRAVVRTFDPYVLEHSTASSLEEALEGADAAIIATDHECFRILTPFNFASHGVDVVIDGRNCLRKEDFADGSIIYSGIGRTTV